MAECYRCPYIYYMPRKYGSTSHCSLARYSLDVTYYCERFHRSEENLFCPFVNALTRFPVIDYHKYKTDFLTVKENTNEST